MKVFCCAAAAVAMLTVMPSSSAFSVRHPSLQQQLRHHQPFASTFVLEARKKAQEEEDESSSSSSSKKSSSSSSMDPAKRAALDGVLNQIERSYGRGSILKLGDAGNMVVESISSGALTLDAALGGGFPKGRVVEIYGPESSGKTTLALHAIAECQKAGGTAAFVDAEHALDPAYGEFGQGLCTAMGCFLITAENPQRSLIFAD
jgi:recA bacterial DNA recombination protein